MVRSSWRRSARMSPSSPPGLPVRAEIEQAPQAFVDPWPLLAAGLEIDLFGDQAHDGAEFLAVHRSEMTQHRRCIRARRAGHTVERRAIRLRRKGKHRAEGFRRRAPDRQEAPRRGSRSEPGRRDRGSLGCAIEADQRARRKRIVPAGVQHDDGDGNGRLQPRDESRERHQPFGCRIQRRQVGIDRNEEVFAAGFDAVAGVVEQARRRRLPRLRGTRRDRGRAAARRDRTW